MVAGKQEQAAGASGMPPEADRRDEYHSAEQRVDDVRLMLLHDSSFSSVYVFSCDA